MKRSAYVIGVISLFSIACSHTADRDDKNLAGNHWLLIEAPHSPADWTSWRQQLRQWKDSLLSAIKYDDAYFKKPEYQWAADAYSTLFSWRTTAPFMTRTGTIILKGI